MATVGVSDFIHLPSKMVVGDAHSTPSIRSESTHNLSALAQSRLPNGPSIQARIPSTTALPTQTSGSRTPATRSRASSHSKPIDISNQKSVRLQEAGTPEANGGVSNGNIHDDQGGHGSIPPSPRLQPTQRSMLSFSGSGSASPARIKVRDLNHIQSFASEEVLTRSRHGSSTSLKGKRSSFGQQYEISAMPVADIIEMVAGLLTKITTTNDRQHEHIHRHIPPPEGTAGLSQQATSVLAFHGKNAPSITILSYLSRIHKYCPTTYEVFLSLLVYFDRMAEVVNSGSLSTASDDDPTEKKQKSRLQTLSETLATPQQPATPPPSGPFGPQKGRSLDPHTSQRSDDPDADVDAYNLSHFFVVDSFNIHRLVIAGVTCASKFFSDVFYTNSRYAKVIWKHPEPRISADQSQVGGLPLVELNHLELQFLLLNDFRLSVPVEELEAYGTMLVEFYAREVMTQHHGGMEGLYMQTPTPP